MRGREDAGGEQVLVTGGAGYIGSHVCRRLHAAGYRPVVYDDLSTGHRDAVRWGPLEVGDVGDARRVAAVIARHRPTAVLHLAASASVGESVADPGRYYRNNVAGTLGLLEAMRHHGLDRLVFSSTCAVHGTSDGRPRRDGSRPEPLSPYGASKAMVERILRDESRAHGLRATTLRFFNAAGAHPSGRIGERHDPETHLIPRALAAAYGRSLLDVHGDQHPTPDGTCIRDYVHVEDLAAAHVLALRQLEAGGSSATYDLGSGVGTSVRQVIDQVQATTGRAVAIRIRSPRAGDPPVQVARSDDALGSLGWRPRRSDLRTIVEDAWRWHRQQRPSAGDRGDGTGDVVGCRPGAHADLGTGP